MVSFRVISGRFPALSIVAVQAVSTAPVHQVVCGPLNVRGEHCWPNEVNSSVSSGRKGAVLHKARLSLQVALRTESI